MKQIKLIVPDDTIAATITIISRTRPNGTMLIRAHSFDADVKKLEIKWDEQDGEWKI